ncbi:MAG TPA: inorganic phosphate transporter [Planctomycetaceae bacterium]|nr:inorganic phosphate transporter [Planctomycetaceae bacterium]
MSASLWQALNDLPVQQQLGFAFALFIAFAFEFINGFHDTANAVTTVIYTDTLKPLPAVIYSGFCNFLGVLLGGTTVAFAIVNLLPVDVLIASSTLRSVVMVISLLLAGVIWNLGTWWYGLPVSSSHTLIGSILGVGLANSLLTQGDVRGVNWGKAVEVALSLLISPILGFVLAAGLLVLMKRIFKSPNLYHPPGEGDNPPDWIRGVLMATCGGVSLAHGSNDGQKGMGLILLVLIGFLPNYYSLNVHERHLATAVSNAAESVTEILQKESPEAAAAVRPQMEAITSALAGKSSLASVAPADRWTVRQSIFEFRQKLQQFELTPETRRALAPADAQFARAIEFVPYWVIVGVALALGVGTGIGYKRIVVTVAEKIGKAHLSYAQGAAAEIVAAATIGLADVAHLPVSTTHVLSSGVAGTMAANNSGLRGDTLRKIGLAWVLTLPAAILLAAGLFWTGCLLVPEARMPSGSPKAPASTSKGAATGGEQTN